MPQGFPKKEYAPCSVLVTAEVVEQFLDQQRQKQLTEGSLSRYALSLRRLQEYLAPSGELGPGTLQSWQRELRAEGYSTSTINLNISVANSLLDFLHRGDLKADVLLSNREQGAKPSPMLTRAEYLQLLQTARLQGKERAYLLIKLFGTVPLSANELDVVTVEYVQNGRLLVSRNRKKSPEMLYIPSALRAELLAYAAGQGIDAGMIFRSRVGTPYSRSNATLEMQHIARDAHVPPEKATPRALKKLCQRTMDDIQERLRLQAMQEYEALLDSEQQSIGWQEKKDAPLL